MAEQLFYFFIYPGMLFAGIIGIIFAWADRKVTARVQFRQGPPVLQPFYDFIKLLLVKETILPKNGSVIFFLLAPVLGLFGATAAAVIILMPALGLTSGFRGDIIVLFYLLAIPTLMFIVGALASGNPLSSVGASREIKMVLSYELSFILIIAGVILKSEMTLQLNEIMALQQSQGAFIASLSGIVMFIAALVVIQGKAGMVPFDMAEAETELAEGIFMEYSGTAYAIIKYTKYILLFILPVFIAEIFLGGLHFEGIHILWSILKVLLVLVLMILIRNTNPRLKIGQAMRFYLLWINLLVIAGLVLHYIGI
ncbi:MAG: NADH-quinone oxidoreductase subunit H [Bacteroidales bacterium]|nr:NADH-quinone oxidoreductase subunit H [Bacteroidales bacterium]MCF8328438.1 NADH-quinone oxidoreductase subunit H [Bacteroidales bacterium]